MASLVAPMRFLFFCLDKDPEIWMRRGAVAMLVLAFILRSWLTPERPGVKFADADLIGSHGRLLWARRALQTHRRVKERATGERFEVALDEVGFLCWCREDPSRARALKYTTN